MMKELERYFELKVEIPLLRHGQRQRIEPLINEETLLFAKYLRNEKTDWTPRIEMHACEKMIEVEIKW